MNVPSSTRFKELLEDELEDKVGEWRVGLREGVESWTLLTKEGKSEKTDRLQCVHSEKVPDPPTPDL
jgi:hypothetical protein